MMKMKEFRNLADDELLKKEKDFKKELFEASYERQMGRVEKPARFGLLRRNIAKILTILNERKIKTDGTKNK